MNLVISSFTRSRKENLELWLLAERGAFFLNKAKLTWEKIDFLGAVGICQGFVQKFQKIIIPGLIMQPQLV